MYANHDLIHMENFTVTHPWNIYRKSAFRFAFIFVILFIVFLDFYSNLFTDLLYDFAQLSKLSDIVILWIGSHLFHIPYTII